MSNTLWTKIEAKFAELKTALTAKSESAAIVDHSAIISSFQTQLDGFKVELDAKDKTISEHVATIAAHVANITAKDGEITKLKADAKSAGEKAVDIIAATGVAAADLPEAGKPSQPGAKTDSLVKSRKEMAAMKPAELLAFSKAGGKFTD